jgi:hypothetical protein
MAAKASLILSVELSTERVTYRRGDGITKTDRFSYLSKVDKLATLKALGWRSEGKPPMHLSDAEIQSAWFGIWNDSNHGRRPSMWYNTEAPKVPQPSKEDTMPQPTPKPKASTKPETQPQGGALEKALASILEGVVADSIGDLRLELDEVRDLIAKVQPKVTEIHLSSGEIRKVDGVQHAIFPKVLVGLNKREALWLVGPAGTGKSTIAEQAAQALGLDFSSRSCSAQTTETAITGYMDATGTYRTTEFRERYEKGGVMLLDEVDNGNPNVLTVLNSALSNNFMAFPDGMVRRHQDFVLVATANTFGNGATAEYVGRNAIDKAFVDRFSFLEVNYDRGVEEAMLASVTDLHPATAAKWLDIVTKCRANAETYGLKVIISPRATLKGAKWLSDGSITVKDVVDMVILKGAKPEQASKILEGVAL